MKKNKHTLIFLSVFLFTLVLFGCAAWKLLKHPSLSMGRYNFALAKHGAKAIASSEAPGHPASEAIDGDTASLRGWRPWGWGDVRGDRLTIRHVYLYNWTPKVNKPPLPTKEDKLRIEEEILQRAPWLAVQFATESLISKVVIYTIDDKRYPAKDYGINRYQLYYQSGEAWRLICEGKGNLAGKIEHHFKPIRTKGIKLKVIETNDFLHLRHSATDQSKKHLIWYQENYMKGKKVSWSDEYKEVIPNPLKYISVVVELEAYGYRDAFYGNIDAGAVPYIPQPSAEGSWKSYTSQMSGFDILNVHRILPKGNVVWFGAIGSFAWYNQSTNSWEVKLLPKEARTEKILSLAFDDDILWVGTNHAVYQLDGKTKQWNQKPVIPVREGVLDIFIKQPTVWFITRQNVIRYDKTKDKWEVEDPVNKYSFWPMNFEMFSYKNIPPVSQKGLVETQWPFVWFFIFPYAPMLRTTQYSAVAVANLELEPFYYDGPWPEYVRLSYLRGEADIMKRHPTRYYFPADGWGNKYVTCLALDGGFVWVGTQKGVACLDLISDTWQRYTVSDGIPDNYIRTIAVGEKEVWVATNGGIAKFAKQRGRQ